MGSRELVGFDGPRSSESKIYNESGVIAMGGHRCQAASRLVGGDVCGDRGRFSVSRSHLFKSSSFPCHPFLCQPFSMIPWESIGRGMDGKGVSCLCQFMHRGTPTPKTAHVIAIVMAFLLLSTMLPFPFFDPGPMEFSWPEKWECILDLQLP